MRADEIMSPAVVTVRATQPIADAVDALSECGVRHLPVLGDAGQLVGMLSDRDLRSLGITPAIDMTTSARVRERMRASVASAMTSDVATVTPDTDVAELIDAMLEAGVGAVPVVDEETDTLVGIVSYVDVLRAVRPLAAEA
jgi:acetoin utilization protein AcuB